MGLFGLPWSFWCASASILKVGVQDPSASLNERVFANPW
jgi:hypothetical protein